MRLPYKTPKDLNAIKSRMYHNLTKKYNYLTHRAHIFEETRMSQQIEILKSPTYLTKIYVMI